MNRPELFSLILSGGSGVRLWPSSTPDLPKPFITLPDGETLLQKAYKRAASFSSQIITVTNRRYHFQSLHDLDKLNISSHFLLEPAGRDTAPAVAIGAKFIQSMSGPDALMLVIPADHIINDEVALSKALNNAMELAQQDLLVAFGIPPVKPETGYGYVEIGAPFLQGNLVNRFIEKPDLFYAKQYMSSKNFLWNSGMYCFKAGIFLQELEKYAPDILNIIDDCYHLMHLDAKSLNINIPRAYEESSCISLDYAVIEKSDRVAVVSGDFDWSDVGSWQAMAEMVEPDSNQNRKIGDVIFLDTTNTFVRGRSRPIAISGVHDLLIVDEPDGLLIVKASKAHDIKKIVKELDTLSHKNLSNQEKVYRPWGSYTVIQELQGFKVKQIIVNPGEKLSLQMHKHRSEHWILVQGSARVTNGAEIITLRVNESVSIPAGSVHRLENVSQHPCVLIEVQLGDYLGEDDIVRFDDIYGRHN